MKCPICRGRGEYIHAIGGYRPCEHCNGTGKIPQSNNEWFCSLSIKDKAVVLAELSSYGGNVEALEEWLRKEHMEG